MPIGDKTKNTYKKVAATFEKKGDKEWAKAKNDEGGYHYANARKNYETADRARKSARNK